jgi:cytochrome c biogenesis protein CcmG/thiol:disulfide interchange protein DsbE
MTALVMSFGTAAYAQCTAQPKAANFSFTLKDMHGNDVDLADHAGNVILIDFWATWCAPCRIEIPGFIEMVETYGPQGFSVLGISIDDPPDALQSYAEELGMNYPVLIGDGRDDVKDDYGPIIGFPTSVIVDRAGNICHRHIGFTPKERFIEDIEALL